jgi:hypothetical protein
MFALVSDILGRNNLPGFQIIDEIDYLLSTYLIWKSTSVDIE